MGINSLHKKVPECLHNCYLKKSSLYCTGKCIYLVIVSRALICACSFSERIIKVFGSIFYVLLNCSFNNAFFIFIYKRINTLIQFQETTGCNIYHVPSPFEENECFSYSFTMYDRKRSATTNIFLIL